MGQLAFVGSHSINGVSALHSDLVKKTLFSDLNRLYPGRINNKTNGVTPRRWLMQCNPGLTKLIAERIGPEFQDDIDLLVGLDKHADDPTFQEQFAAVKRANKEDAGQGHQGPARGGGFARRAVRRAGQAHPRVQAPAAQHHRGGGAVLR